ncbi:hypothetical protein [Parabacteroides pacaensis]|uniref:hypothetical protein n=1 Tax=Parabacteroides pacaensis TaxID=2086575 RepID=UPI000D0FF061|nr:hypothetical protein [Parabacteroides pacaensis]
MKKIDKYICFCLFIGILFSCGYSPKEKDEMILKKVMSNYIVKFKNEAKETIKQREKQHDSIRIKELQEETKDVIFYIRTKSSLFPDSSFIDSTLKAVTYPYMSLYVFYCMNWYGENELAPPPSKLFYVRGYPVLLYDPEIPPMKSEDIPLSIKNPRKEEWGSEDEWLVGICKKTHKYIVIHDSFINGNDTTIKKLNAFSCDN